MYLLVVDRVIKQIPYYHQELISRKELFYNSIIMN